MPNLTISVSTEAAAHVQAAVDDLNIERAGQGLPPFDAQEYVKSEVKQAVQLRLRHVRRSAYGIQSGAADDAVAADFDAPS